ncbi:MAG: hypothetical protein ABJA94_02275 [Rhodoglobus sp.]
MSPGFGGGVHPEPTGGGGAPAAGAKGDAGGGGEEGCPAGDCHDVLSVTLPPNG